MPSELILAFDTSASHCAAALLSGDQVLAQCHEEMARGQAERLMPLLDGMLAAQGKTWRDLDALAVGIGPGNFTGIRIAVSAARGLALGLGVPAIGVSVFDARAEGLTRPVTVVEDARRDQIYVQRMDEDAPRLMDAQGFVADTPLTGSAAFSVANGAQVLEPRYPLAVAIAHVARKRLGQDNPRPAPLYLRAADAKPPSDPAPVLLA